MSSARSTRGDAGGRNQAIVHHNWQNNQLGKGPSGSDAKIVKETEENEGGTVWSDRKDMLKRCIAQKKDARLKYLRSANK